MTKDQYWQARVKKNPDFEDETKTIQMTVGMLHKLLDEAYDKGVSHSVEVMRQTQSKLKDIFKGVDLGKPWM